MRAHLDPFLSARVVGRRPLHYQEGADPTNDRPAHVRSGSGLAWVGRELAVLQDDANFLAMVDPRRGVVRSIELPPGEGGRRLFDDSLGNKGHKMDLEACFSLERAGRTTLIGWGSGSTRARERILVADFPHGGLAPTAHLIDAASLYERLRADVTFSGSELNIEGAALIGHVVRLFQRGNGAPTAGAGPVDATCDLRLDDLLAYLDGLSTSPPAMAQVTVYDLGAHRGHRLTFTDACERPPTRHEAHAGAAALYLAVAEDSPDTVRDGPVSCAAVGIIDSRGARQTLLVDEAGRHLADKVEGIATDPARPRTVWAVVDRDDPQAAAELLTIELTGSW